MALLTMDKKTKRAIEKFQCAGCISGHDITCYKKNEFVGIGCGEHKAGTIISNIGTIFLGLPRGFNRLGEFKNLIPVIFNSCEDFGYNKFNIPVWKHVTKEGYTLVRGIMPRRNEPFLHIFLKDCSKEIDCLEITESDINDMD